MENKTAWLEKLGPQLLFFCPARFWIDHDLKKKMGH